MDPNNRLQLNFGNGDRNNQFSDRAYPTTPSTFPQPVFQNQGGGQDGFGQQPASNGYGGAGGTGGAGGGGGNTGTGGYFMNNLYTPQFSQQQQGYQPNFQAPQPSYQPRPGGYNDGPNGLAQQLSHQHLGNPPRPSAGWRSPALGSQRPKAETSGSSHSSTVNQSSMANVSTPQLTKPELPEKMPEPYIGLNSKQAAILTGEYVANFFKQNVGRARDRNERQLELEKVLADPKISQQRKEQKRLNAFKAEADYLRFLRTKEVPQNFNTLKIIGKGAFGEVKLVQKKADGKIYALKSLVKAEMFKKDQLAHVRAERDILAESDSPWVVKLFTTFQDSTFLYMLMEFLPGGDLMTMLIKYEIFSEDITRFYMAEIVLAIEVVHNLGFIHRDIKPDNILLDRNGHIKLTDFGLSTGFHKQHENSYYQQLLTGSSKKTRDRNSVSLDHIHLTVSNRGQINTWRKSRRVMAYSTVGTPDYIAPEIFGGKGYSFECDWWSLGTIMFECLIGWPPFCAEDPHDTYRKIVNWRDTLYFPEDLKLGAEAEHLIRSLICDSSDRLGRGGAQEIKNHAFFRGVFNTELRSIRAPFEPKLTSNVDVSYFPTEEIDQDDTAATRLAQTNQQILENGTAAEMSLPFVGYTYKRFDSFRGQ
ncbi:MAG: Serine/threonine-protein kinase [Thelocarpon superellum]|nr:MAG: Serine/threonine-protein kinase [Thelocarpon superellum]